MKEIVVAIVGIGVSVASSVSSSSYFVGSRIENHESRITAIEVRNEKYDATQKELLQSLQTIKVDVAVTKNNILWMRKNNDPTEFTYNQTNKSK